MRQAGLAGRYAHVRQYYGYRNVPIAVSNAVGYAKFYSRSHDAVIRVYDEAGERGLEQAELSIIEIHCRGSFPCGGHACGPLLEKVVFWAFE